MKRLVLIDGNGMLHRAYHALPPLTNPQGEIVNAVYGFFSMLLTVLQDLKPDYIAVCFDRSKPTIRQSLYAGYHAHRPQITSDFSSQILIVDQLLEIMGMEIFALDGFEGDDLIGTLAMIASKHKEKQLETIIVTSDRDMLQLVTSQTKILMPITGISKTILFGMEQVKEKYGVDPVQFIDYKALIGDPSDGYPGVSGIGPKTASGLLQKYKTFENLYQHINELPEKIGIKLATDAEQAALAKKLATIICDVPIQFDLTKCQVMKFDILRLRESFLEQGFKSLAARLEKLFPQVLVKKEKKKKTVAGQIELL